MDVGDLRESEKTTNNTQGSSATLEPEIWSGFERATRKNAASAKKCKMYEVSSNDREGSLDIKSRKRLKIAHSASQSLAMQKEITTSRLLTTRKYSEKWSTTPDSCPTTIEDNGDEHMEVVTGIASVKPGLDELRQISTKKQFLSQIKHTFEGIDGDRGTESLCELAMSTRNNEFVQKLRSTSYVGRLLEKMTAVSNPKSIQMFLYVVILNNLIESSGESFIFTCVKTIDQLVAASEIDEDILLMVSEISCKQTKSHMSNVIEEMFSDDMRDGHHLTNSYASLAVLVKLVSNSTSTKIIKLMHQRFVPLVGTLSMILQRTLSGVEGARLQSCSSEQLLKISQLATVLEFACQARQYSNAEVVASCVEVLSKSNWHAADKKLYDSTIQSLLQWLIVVASSSTGPVLEALINQMEDDCGFVDILLESILKRDAGEEIDILSAGLAIELLQDGELCQELLKSPKIQQILELTYSDKGDLVHYCSLLLGLLILTARKFSIQAFTPSQEKHIREQQEQFVIESDNPQFQAQLLRVLDALLSSNPT